MKDYMILIPIFGLFLVGLFITLKSGFASGSRSKVVDRTRIVSENFYAMFLRIIGYIAGLVVVEQVLGMPSLIGW